MMKHFDDYDLQEIRELLGHEPKPVFAFSRAFPGWECDSIGWVVENKKGKNVLILSNHGSKFVANGTSELKSDIQRYEQLISEAEEALIILKNKRSKNGKVP